MQRREVRIGLQVYRELDRITREIAKSSRRYADAWEQRLFETILSLAEPADYAIDEEVSARTGFEIRRVVFERTYLLFYSLDVERDIVEVIGLRHGARLPRDDEY